MNRKEFLICSAKNDDIPSIKNVVYTSWVSWVEA